MTKDDRNQKVEKVEKELIKILLNFRPNKSVKGKKINLLQFLVMIIGFFSAIVYLIYFRAELSDFIFSPSSTYRFAALPAIVGFPITSALIGIIIGLILKILIDKLKR